MRRFLFRFRSRKLNLPEQLSVNEDEKGMHEEFSYLNNLTLVRIQDTNLLWITSLGSIAALIGISETAKDWVFAYLGLWILPAFLHYLSWLLDGIIRIRTYIKAIVQPRTGGLWEDMWPVHPLLTQSKVIVNVPFIFCGLFAVIIAALLYTSKKHFSGDSVFLFLLFIPPLSLILYSFGLLVNSFNKRRFIEYYEGWVALNQKTKSNQSVVTTPEAAPPAS